MPRQYNYPYHPEYKPGEEIYYSKDYGVTGEMGIIVNVCEESNTATIRYTYDGEYVEVDVHMRHLYARDILSDW